MIQLLKKYVRKENTDDEEGVVNDFYNGELKRIYLKFEYLAKINDELENKNLKKILKIINKPPQENIKPAIEELYHIISYAEGIIKLYSQGIEINNLSKFFMACKKFGDEESIELCLSIIDDVYKDSKGISSEDYYWIGMFYEEGGREGKAYECFKKAVKKDKRNRAAFTKYILYSRKYNPDLEYIKKINQIFRSLWPDDSFSIVLDGDIYLGLRKFPEAIHAYYSAIKVDPDNAEAYAGKADVMLQINERERAKELYEKALNIDSNCKRAQQGLKKII